MGFSPKIAAEGYQQLHRSMFPVKLRDPRNYRAHRIQQGTCDCNRYLFVFATEKHRIESVRILLPGRLRREAESRVFWDLIVEFPGEYPLGRPNLRFLAVPHLRPELISESGNVQLSAVMAYHGEPVYHPAMSLREVICRLSVMMKKAENWQYSARRFRNPAPRFLGDSGTAAERGAGESCDSTAE
jgi:ubiquitin-protein ligase